MDFIKEGQITPREYQTNIANAIMKYGNTLVVLPTGLGKTIIAIFLFDKVFEKKPTNKILFLAPTKPLVQQHAETITKLTNIEPCTITGTLAPKKRILQILAPENQIIIATPQTIENDLKHLPKDLFNLVVFDECHKAQGSYAYVACARHFEKALKVGMSASPGTNKSEVKEIMNNLGLENIELRTETDDDVSPYLHDTNIYWVKIALPDQMKEVNKLLNEFVLEKAQTLIKMGYYLRRGFTQTEVLVMQKRISADINKKNPLAYSAASTVSTILKINHAIILLETQGVKSVKNYLERMSESENQSKANMTIQKDQKIQRAKYILEGLDILDTEHPKIKKLEELILKELNEKPQSKIIVFNQYRDSITNLETKLNSNPLICAKRFIGQATKGNDKGLSQEEQKQIIDEFKEGKYNVLIASSIHPDEYIVIHNNKEDRIEIKKIGEFVDSFIPEEVIESKVKQITGYSTISYNGNKTIFLPVTHVHKHPRKSRVVETVFSSGFRVQATEDHSFFTFNEKSNLISCQPKQNMFAKICFSAPNIQKNITLDLVKEFNEKLPLEYKNKIFCSILGLNQATIRILTSNKKLLESLKPKSKCITEISKCSCLNMKTVILVVRRLKKDFFVTESKRGKYKTISITSNGQEYLSYLKWFFENCKYHKRKYRVPLKSVYESKLKLEKFSTIFVNANYGKIKLPRFLPVTSKLAELLGLYVAEGDARNTNKTAGIHLAARKKNMQKRMASCVIEGLGIKPSITWRGVDINSKLAYYLIKYVFCAGIGSYNKEVPSIIFNLSNAHKWKFFEGYTRGDGHITNKRIVLTTVSKKLVTGLIFLLRQLGIKKITLLKNKHRTTFDIQIMESVPFQKILVNGKKCYYDLIPLALNYKKKYSLSKNMFNKRIRKKGIVNERNCYDYIKTITPLLQQPKFVYDISVDKTQLFAGGQGLICLHNSVAEEGLDIPNVDTVFFFEPVPSDIRSIQRRGRTGRFNTGTIYVMITEGTRDEIFHWASRKKEKTMKDTISGLNLKKQDTVFEKIKKIEEINGNGITPAKEKSEIKQKLLTDLIKQNDPVEKEIKKDCEITIVVDNRERHSKAFEELKKKEAKIIETNLSIGDYQVGEDCIIERKSVSDFINSLLDGRLFNQAIKMTAFEKSLLIIEGNFEYVFEERDINKSAILGAIFSLLFEFRIPILFSVDCFETAELVYSLAKREQTKKDKLISVRHMKKTNDLHLIQRFVLEGFPHIGPTIAERIISEYSTLNRFFNTSLERLEKLEGIGDKKAKMIWDIIYNKTEEEKTEKKEILEKE